MTKEKPAAKGAGKGSPGKAGANSPGSGANNAGGSSGLSPGKDNNLKSNNSKITHYLFFHVEVLGFVGA